jgi:hypothetical protein
MFSKFLYEISIFNDYLYEKWKSEILGVLLLIYALKFVKFGLNLGSTLELGQARSMNTEGSGLARAWFSKLELGSIYMGSTHLYLKLNFLYLKVAIYLQCKLVIWYNFIIFFTSKLEIYLVSDFNYYFGSSEIHHLNQP